MADGIKRWRAIRQHDFADEGFEIGLVFAEALDMSFLLKEVVMTSQICCLIVFSNVRKLFSFCEIYSASEATKQMNLFFIQ